MNVLRKKLRQKKVRQQYRNCVNQGTRSGSGRIVQGQWETLTKIWGGSPAVTKIDNSISSNSLSMETELSQIEGEDIEGSSQLDTGSTTDS